MAKLISVIQALDIIKNTAQVLGDEWVDIGKADGRVLAQDILAKTTLPPLSASAMDGYAVKLSPEYNIGTKLDLIGVSPAGDPFKGVVKTGQAVRIYTGGAVPEGADHVIMQENVKAGDGFITLSQPISPSTHIRKAGIDFKQGACIAKQGQRLDPYALALIAAANHDKIKVYKRPMIALIANGDELVPPGTSLKTGQIISSNSYGLAPLLKGFGVQILDCGISKDQPDAIKKQIKKAMQADILVPVGGASVGDRDFMRSVFADLGYQKLFEKVAIKPGKPVWFGTMPNNNLADKYVLGLPGNPASAIVTAYVFIRPLVQAILGQNADNNSLYAQIEVALKPATWRTEYIRAIAKIDKNGQIKVRPYPMQDSSLLTPFLSANCYLIRKPESSLAEIGDKVEILPFKPFYPDNFI